MQNCFYGTQGPPYNLVYYIYICILMSLKRVCTVHVYVINVVASSARGACQLMGVAHKRMHIRAIDQQEEFKTATNTNNCFI